MVGDIFYDMWLSYACGAGSSLAIRLYEWFGSSREVYAATDAQIREALHEMGERQPGWDLVRSLDQVMQWAEWCQREHVSVISIASNIYPGRLKAMRDPPIVLYYKGALPEIDDNVCIAMVGTRKCSDYGIRAAAKLAGGIAAGGAIIVSGMALGIDTACHRACMDAGGITLAVLGCGIDTVYPPGNEKLMADILQRGAVITEYAPFSPPTGSNFPIRNRIISGLCLGTVVVEADEHSGALITGNLALLQGRDVFAVPGDIFSKNSRGTLNMLRGGSHVASCAEDVLGEYEFIYPHRIKLPNSRRGEYDHPKTDQMRFTAPLKVASNIKLKKNNAEADDELDANIDLKVRRAARQSAQEQPAPKRREIDMSMLSPTERAVYDMLHERGALISDAIVGQDLPISDVLTALTVLEMYGLIRGEPGGMFAVNE